MNLKILNAKEKNKIINLIKKQYSIKDLKLDYIFLKNKDNKIFLLSNDFSKLDVKNIKIETIGLYFATIKDNSIRLSTEGSQLVGKKAKKNIINLNEKQINEWVKGNNIETKQKSKDFVLIKHKDDFYGSGRIKNNTIINFVPKNRRIK